jgi:cellulose synthase/poly-beta-1,6-N-acetylglucosamine synthase-like glycosyltransferase
MIRWSFWLSAASVAYAYVGYPLLAWAVARRRPAAAAPHTAPTALPAVTMIVPVHNEAARIADKIANTRNLDYPADALRVVFVSDGSTDGTVEAISAAKDARFHLIALEQRSVVFSDVSIALQPDAITAIVRPFAAPDIGCVSGEDRIEGSAGEGLYGRYEMFLRRQESRLGSIVGASGSFYAQRRELCGEFPPSVAPDFLSVLRTVGQGFRAVSEAEAVGYMSAVDDPRDEFARKVRTILRGITTLGQHLHLVNPFRYGWFAVALLSHKVMRWLVPGFLVVMLLTSALLAVAPLYAFLLVAQLAFYVLAYAAYRGPVPALLSTAGRVASYFTAANVATLVAWGKYFRGTRQELWSPSRR